MSRVASARRQRGLSIVELLVGVAVGLFLLGGATKLFVDYLVDNRRVLVETRVTQDLRAAADLIVRDLRRAGYWADASNGMVAAGASSAPLNPFRAITVSNQDLTVGDLTFTYDRAASAVEAAGFRVRNGALEMQLGTAWQAVTDTGSLFIDLAQLQAPVLRTVDLYMSCPCVAKLTCTTGSFLATDPATGASGVNYPTRPRLTVRQYALTLRGYAPTDTQMRREVRETVRVRNDETDGACPPA